MIFFIISPFGYSQVYKNDQNKIHKIAVNNMEMGKMEQEDKGLRFEVDPPINNPTE